MSDKKGNSEKRVIASHKGGRTARFDCRINPEVKERLLKLAEAEGISTADLLEKWVLNSKL
jgi:predicted HicB family RNase H-like nuclease